MEPGRARGRARSRAGPAGSTEASDDEASTSDDPIPGSSSEGESAMRGRGGFRTAESLRTIPPTVTETCGTNTGNIKILTNYYRLKVPDDQVIYTYRIDFEPAVEALKVRRGLVFSISECFKGAYVFDGGNEVKALEKIEDCTLPATKRDGSSVSVYVKRTSTVGWGHPEMLRLYNTQMRRNLQHLGMTQVGRDYFDRVKRRSIDDFGVEVWPGMLTAINEHDGGILMCVDLIHKVIRRETALEALRRYLDIDREKFRDLARQDMPGKIVMTKYNNKTYRIDDVDFTKNPVTYTFDRSGTTISLKDYYQEQYNLSMEDERQPLLIVRPSDKQLRGGDDKEVALIPEFCLMTGITDRMRNDFNFKKALDNITRLPPVAKVNSLNEFMSRVSQHEKINTEMAKWQMEYETSLVQMTGGLLDPEKIQTFGDEGQSGIMYNQTSGNFERELRSLKMKRPVRMEQWCLIAVRKDKPLIDEYFSCMRRICVPLGIEIGQPRLYPIENDRTSTYLEACRSIPEQAKLCIIVVPNNNAERYSAVKRYFCVEAAIPSQVITTRVLGNKKGLMTITTKILVQMATKLGAEPWGVIIPARNTMFVGYDTYHDSERKSHSVGGFVCSQNQSATSWFSRTAYHESRDELSANFANNFRAGLKNWESRNNGWPSRIVVYRDGVSEGQIAHVYQIEVKEMEKVLKEKPELSETMFTFIIVTKRVNARFFKIEGRDLVNPVPGTCMDAVVTRKLRWDFYLISQSVRQGTVNPTMYNVIADTTGWKLMHHQQLAYKLCHLYYNWAGTISVPAPCQYAHKLAYLTGTALHKEHHVNLANRLFYL